MKKLRLIILFIISGMYLTNGQIYCVPTVDVANGASSGITNVHFGDINRTSVSTEGYNLFSETTMVQTGEEPFSITSTPGTASFCTVHNIRVYIDFNNDKDFTDANEEVFIQDNVIDGTYTGYITIPANATLDTTRMRVMAKMAVGCGHTLIEPCGSDASLGYHGEVEDYDIIIEVGSGIRFNEENQIGDVKLYSQNGENLVIEYVLTKPASVSINVLNVLGQSIHNQPVAFQNDGHYKQIVSMNDHKGSSVYIVQLNVDGQLINKKYILAN